MAPSNVRDCSKHAGPHRSLIGSVAEGVKPACGVMGLQAMSERPENMEEWCKLVPNLLSEDGWQAVLQDPSSAMLHRCCPWGGSLVKFVLRDMLIQDPPDDPADVLVRPEVRASKAELDETWAALHVLAPADCTMHWSVSPFTNWKVTRYLDVLFGLDQHFGCWRDSHATLRRNFPQVGDCAMAMREASQRKERLAVSRPQQDGKFSVYVIFAFAATLSLPKLAAPHLPITLQLLRSTVNWCLNRPGAAVERHMSRTFYVVLALSSFKRGWPMIPARGKGGKGGKEKPATINRGRDWGLGAWERYRPAMAGSCDFHLSEYLCHSWVTCYILKVLKPNKEYNFKLLILSQP